MTHRAIPSLCKAASRPAADTRGRNVRPRSGKEQQQAELLDAYESLVRSVGSERPRSQRPASALVELYDAWHEAETDAGYDAKAAEWREKLPEPAEEEITTPSGEGSGS